MTQDRASVVEGTMQKRMEATRAGKADVTVVPFFLHSRINAIDESADIDKDLNLVVHGSRIGLPVHTLRVGAVDLLPVTGMGNGCNFSKGGSSGASGE